MNSLKIIVSVFAIGLLITSCKQTDSNVSEKKSTLETSSTSKKPISADAKLVTTSFTIEGMTCAIGCAKTIEKELNETNGVKKQPLISIKNWQQLNTIRTLKNLKT